MRTLRHYDRIGLLRPAARSNAGYRLYRESDLARIRQIAVLKFLGMPLTKARELLRGQTNLAEVMRDQRRILADKRRRLTFAIETVEKIQTSADDGREPDWTDLSTFAREVAVQSLFERGAKKTPLGDARKTILERRLNWTATLGDYELGRDIRAAIARGATPASPEGRHLVARWKDAIERFVGGDAELRAALNLVMADRVSWPGPALTEQFREYFDSAMKSA
jgi:DNA-binding transcriptional MerR regulator